MDRPYEVIMPNGDRAEADDLAGALYAARTMTDDASTHYGSSRLTRSEIIVTCDGVYDGPATRIARAGHTVADLERL